jgi:signal transduction histidine kinase
VRCTRQRDTIGLAATQEKREVVIVFQDSETGVAEEKLERIFELFYRSTGSRRDAEFGLGLFTVRSILNPTGGASRLFHHPDKDSGLSFELGLQDTGSRRAYATDSICRSFGS